MTIFPRLPSPPPSPPTHRLSVRRWNLNLRRLSLSLLRHLFPSTVLPHRPIYLPLAHSHSHFNTTFLFLDRRPPYLTPSLPPIIVPPNTLSLSSGHRIARVVKDAISFDVPGVYWYVFGDDDTLSFAENLVRILSKYDHDKWYYIGCNSENYEQNEKFCFDMDFGGGGYTISAPLARVHKSCPSRYPHFYGSDTRIFACLTELGVQLTVEPGFHQVDVRGNLFGLLSAHPLSLVASLHHIDDVEPFFPDMSKIQALEHLFSAVRVDPARILQQTVCNDNSNSLIVSVSWGYAVQIYEGNNILPEVLSMEVLYMQRSFRPWKRGENVASSHFMFNTIEYPSD